MKNKIGDSFKGSWDTDKLGVLVNGLVDELVKTFNPLSYFRTYLTEHLTHDLAQENISFNEPTIDATIIQNVINGVLELLKSKVRTALVLGGYDDRQEDKEKYPGFNSYIYWNNAQLNKNDAFSTMCNENDLTKQVTYGVQSAPFFSKYDTYDSIYDAIYKENDITDEKLFKIGLNPEFIGISGLTDNDALKLSWNNIKNWLFSNERSNVEILKAFVRTQIYRTMFFDAGNFITFSRDDNAYKCITSKWYYNHDGELNQLVFEKDEHGIPQYGDMTKLDLYIAGVGEGQIRNVKEVKNIQYSTIANRFSYEMEYNPIEVIDCKFTYDDVEYYVTYGENEKASSLYFNQFQSALNVNSKAIDINGDKFELNGVTYVISEGVLMIELKDKNGNLFFDNQYRQEIIDDRFSINGIRYFLTRGENGEYSQVKFAEVEDKKLNHLRIT